MRVIFIIINWLWCLSRLDISIGHTSLDSFLLFFVLLCNRFPHLLINVWLPIVAASVAAASSRHNGYAKNVTSSIFRLTTEPTGRCLMEELEIIMHADAPLSVNLLIELSFSTDSSINFLLKTHLPGRLRERW